MRSATSWFWGTNYGQPSLFGALTCEVQQTGNRNYEPVGSTTNINISHIWGLCPRTPGILRFKQEA
jgi:hypothetical protein